MATNPFNSMESISPPRSRHILKETHYFDTAIGWVIPASVNELLPGDNIDINFNCLIKGQTMPVTPFGKVSAYINAFFVPTRLVDDDWEKRITGVDEKKARRGDNSLVPYSTDFPALLTAASGDTTNTLQEVKKYQLRDYMSWPLGSYAGQDMSQFTIAPLCAYHKVWNDYFRPEDYCDVIPDTIQRFNEWTNSRTSYEDASIGDFLGYRSFIMRCMLNNDLFTTALDSQQLGVGAQVPLNGSMNFGFYSVLGEPATTNDSPVTFGIQTWNGKTGLGIDNNYVTTSSDSTRVESPISLDSTNKWFNLGIRDGGDLSISITELRLAQQLQKWAEYQNRCGSRYVEYLKSMFSISPRDERLQRSEWIGGFEMPIVTDTFHAHDNSETDGKKQYIGQEAGKQITGGGQSLGRYFAKEYGYLLLTIHIKPEISYGQGLPKMFIKPSRYDYYNPLFTGLSEQEILNIEVFHKPGDSRDLDIFGYHERYYEYISCQDRIQGAFHDYYANYTWNRTFDSANPPNLNLDFKMCRESDYADKWNVTDEPPYMVQFQTVLDAVRPLPAHCRPL